CLDISNNANKCFGICVSPEPSGRTKNFYNLVDLIFENICNANLLNLCLATLRLEAISENYPDLNIEGLFNSEEEAIDNLNDHNWFVKNGIEISGITVSIFKKAEFS